MTWPADGHLRWQKPGPLMRSEPGTVHLWCVMLDPSVEASTPLGAILASDERQRARAIRLECARREWVMTRGALRDVLARYAGVAPVDVRFSTGRFGKPALHGPIGLRLQFNVSHANGLALVAVAAETAVGVDVEYVRTDIAVEVAAARWLTARERRWVESGLPEERSARSLALWTRKEAYAKATGRGVGADLTTIDLLDAPLGWTAWTLVPLPGYVATVVVVGTASRICGFVWPEVRLPLRDRPLGACP
jgi:4'-phosphopantetheinyl transferase